jgi:hypothetical protein
MRLAHYFSILAIAGIFAACSKGDTGDTGPQGPSGVANINTQEYTVSAWTLNNTTWTSTWSESDITDNNADAVEAYWSVSSSGWLALPDANLFINGDELSYGYDNGVVTFSYYGNPANSPAAYYPTIYFKVTVIPPSIQVKYPGVNWKNAQEVAQLPEVKAALYK